MLFYYLTLASALFTAVFGTSVEVTMNPQRGEKPTGIVVSFSNNYIDWKRISAFYYSFAYIWATAGDEDKNYYLSSHYSSAAGAGLIRGAFHVARPTQSSGGVQADYFVSNGGNWTSDGTTLPGALSIGRYGRLNCHGFNTTSMVSWIRDFSDTYHSRVGRYPVIYTTTDWWNTCTGNDTEFGSTSPLWNFHVPLPNGEPSVGLWRNEPLQNTLQTPHLVRYNGDIGSLKRLAVNQAALV